MSRAIIEYNCSTTELHLYISNNKWHRLSGPRRLKHRNMSSNLIAMLIITILK